MTTVVLPNGQNDERVINGATNGRVRLAEGRYVIGAPIKLGNGDSLVGEGAGTVLARAPGYTGEIINAFSASDVEVADLSIDDQCAAQFLTGAPSAIRFHDCRSAVAESVHVFNGFRNGITISACTDALISRCTTLDCHAIPMQQGGHGGHGIVVWSPFAGSGQGPRSRNVKIRDCTSSGNWRTGFYAVGVELLSVMGCSFENNNPRAAIDAGIEGGGQIGLAMGCVDATIMGNTLIGGEQTQGIEVDVTENGQPNAQKAERITISGNVIKNQGRCGIIVFGDPNADAEHRRAHVTITGNVLERNNRRGNKGFGAIHVQQTITDVVMLGNIIDDDAQGSPGIRMSGNNDRYTIVGNHITISGAQQIGSGAAIDDKGGIAATRTTSPNTMVVNGKVFT